ncbi:bifunctional glutamate N-acetyltransferase/amino-acid acetyltransferase ArgJ [Geoalkalibacter halelectricus]|uniref:Arginine biosynthesis bifunctional protein ArgJ n=1 Tax=Geoalkalibacter halelectricus TaxID=2847045 RepID=A0ABY5ZVV6_9BACT|nr:bifunctional glutamate N-acetyltransferase/amino-acid acetyltransferase ArgJ [Geoalkalibacter halelectricus]MDO3376712.1 bifunctional glutamate N-acetyltransferase/amino-acid acetyltransferase ArgJ [Geoalkalibacter halelectricus]UWZ81336.1 bifunctional glutamate N-acetyltransferase/amino-acid acetyltransferase ArgJ [Geoalkalibacter halelectricus]
MNGHDLPRVRGFKFSARSAGIKKSGRLDLALIFSEVPATCAGVFTTNKVMAAPLVVSAPRIRQGRCQAVLINSGNANACTGEQGLRDALRCGALTAQALGIAEDLVAVASTGVIGVPLPMVKFEQHIPLLPAQLEGNAAGQVAEAIRTTDAFSKTSWCQGQVQGQPYQVLGIAKGAGMIHPNMATMLAYVVTDARVDPVYLDRCLRRAVDCSFNAITVDGDTSTNDMVLALANGQAGTVEINENSAAGDEFAALLKEILVDLAKMIVRDGEGATKVVQILVRGAVQTADAVQVARSVATSNLVKTAFFGEDANWGRIIAAVGYSGVEVDPARIDISFDEVPVVRNGIGTGKDLETQAGEVLKKAEFQVCIDLHLGSAEGVYYTSDLNYDYIKINADYRT